MDLVLTEEQIALQKQQEARNFVGKNGPAYVQDFATEEERKHFEGILYHSGIPILTLISYIASHTASF